MHVFVNHINSAHEMDTEPVTFLGVETVKVSSTLSEQLGLDRGMGLVVQRVIDGTVASEELKKHDILTKLDDQLIVSPDQLGVLVRSKNPGTEVKSTFGRGGKMQTAKVT
jgi:serine protease Do